MSYVFNVQLRVWNRLRELAGSRIGYWPGHLFENLLEAIRSADQRLDNQINRDGDVGRAARELEAWLEKEEESPR